MCGISYPAFKKDVRDYLLICCRGAFVLDVGAGQGIYGQLLGRRFRMQAVEILRRRFTICANPKLSPCMERRHSHTRFSQAL